MARPSIYTEELADKIVALMIEGNSLHAICQKSDMPSYSTAMAWKRDPEHPFSVIYARARDDRGTYWGEKVAEIAMACIQGKIDPKAARVAIQGIMWTAERMNPREFGEKVDISAQITAKVGVLAAPIAPSTVEEWMALERTPDDGPGGAALPAVVDGDIADPQAQPVAEVDPRRKPMGVVRA